MQFAKSAGWVFAGLMLVASGVYAQEVEQKARQLTEPESQQPAENEAREKPLRDAEALMKADRPADAYNLLEPLEFDRSGEVRFDYLIGIAALDSGKPDKATLAFERVLAVDPDYAGARLDMARAYYQLGDLPRAKTEFETVLKQNPSEAARVTIQKYLDNIAGQEAWKQTRISGYVEGMLGQDSNVNNAADQSSVTTGGIVTTLNSTNVEVADYYYGVAAGGEVNHSLNANWGLYAGADLRQRGNKTQKSFDTLSLDGRGGVTYDTGANRFRVGVLGEQHTLGSAHDLDTAGLNAEWRHAVGASNQLNVFGQYVQYRYVDAAMKLNDINQQAAGIGWLHVLGDAKSTLSGSLYYGMENDVGGRTDGANRFGGFRAGGQAALGERTKLFASAGGQVGNFNKVNPTISNQRTDRQYDLTLGANWYRDKLWTVRPQLTHFRNLSNVANYAYDRTDVSLTIRRNFK
jgi:tetratricopeptide (TPR) repeat protein